MSCTGFACDRAVIPVKPLSCEVDDGEVDR